MSTPKIAIDRIEPTDWFVGMVNPVLQLMVYGPGIGLVDDVTTDYTGVTVDHVVRLDSPNYLLVYLDLSQAQPGTMTLTFVRGKARQRVDYQLKLREKCGYERRGFTSADVLYLLMPDRFAQGKGHNAHVNGMRPYREDRRQPSLRHGGDLNGIREHLDYFCELGVTTLWLTPVLENNSPDTPSLHSTYHGYAITNYYRVDPRLGTNDDYRQLCDEAHKRGLKVVMDMIFNHTGFHHPWTLDMPTHDWLNKPEWLSTMQQAAATVPDGFAAGSLASTGSGEGHTLPASFLQTSYKLTPVVDPYASDVDLMETTEGWFVPSMPDLNQHNSHLMRYLSQSSKWWIETVGIDGIRMDTYPYAFADAMAQWMEELTLEYPNFNVVGETWVAEPAFTAAWQDSPTPRSPLPRTYLKTVMDFALFDRLNQAKNEETDDWWLGLNRVYNTLAYDYLYTDPASVMAFIDNHDTNRFMGNSRDTRPLKQALALLLTVKRTPQLYYGTEVLMGGTKDATDGDVRRDFPGGFPGDTHSCFTSEGRTRAEQQMFQWLSRLLHWRQKSDVVAKGKQTQFIPYKGVYVVARHHQGRAVLTVLNGTSQPATMLVERYAEVIGQATRAKDIPTGRYYDLSRNLELKPRQALVLDYVFRPEPLKPQKGDDQK